MAASSDVIRCHNYLAFYLKTMRDGTEANAHSVNKRIEGLRVSEI